MSLKKRKMPLNFFGWCLMVCYSHEKSAYFCIFTLVIDMLHSLTPCTHFTSSVRWHILFWCKCLWQCWYWSRVDQMCWNDADCWLCKTLFTYKYHRLEFIVSLRWHMEWHRLCVLHRIFSLHILITSYCVRI